MFRFQCMLLIKRNFKLPYRLFSDELRIAKRTVLLFCIGFSCFPGRTQAQSELSVGLRAGTNFLTTDVSVDNGESFGTLGGFSYQYTYKNSFLLSFSLDYLISQAFLIRMQALINKRDYSSTRNISKGSMTATLLPAIDLGMNIPLRKDRLFSMTLLGGVHFAKNSGITEDSFFPKTETIIAFGIGLQYHFDQKFYFEVEGSHLLTDTFGPQFMFGCHYMLMQ